MRLTRCENGHMYDLDQEGECPICAEQAQAFKVPSTNGDSKPFFPIARGKQSILPVELADCEVLEQLGQGSTGSVYRIQKTVEYAVKVISCTEPGARANARREYETGVRFAHCPHVICFLHFYEDESSAYILQELADPLLYAYRLREPTVHQVLEAALDVCSALDIIRNMGYLHYDVKPENLFLKDGAVKLGDFSHCMPCCPGLPHECVTGTYQFAAPEIINGEACTGTEDIYSLGVCLYMLLRGGRHPFPVAGRNPPVRLREDVLSPLFLHPSLLAIIEKATAYRAEDRYAKIGQLADDIRAFMAAYAEFLDEVIPMPLFASQGTVQNENAQAFSDAHMSVSAFTVPVLPSPSRSAQAENNYYSVAFPLAQSKHPASFDETQGNPPHIDSVLFSVVAERSVSRSDCRIVEIAMYVEEMRQQLLEQIKNEFEGETIEKTSHALQAAQSAEITVVLSASDIDIEENRLSYRWNGKYLRFSFDYFVPEDYSRRQILFRAVVYIDGVIATTLKFTVNVDQTQEQPVLTREDVHSAFLSYSRKDISAVTYILQALKKARPDMDIFFDVEYLRSGESWEKRLYAELLRRDKLFLCWSRSAAQSVWVEREWTYMADHKGVHAIEPFPLESSAECPVPPRLSELHFDDIEVLIRSSPLFDGLMQKSKGPDCTSQGD